MSLEHHLLDRVRKNHVSNVFSALSTQIDAQQAVISFDMEPAERVTPGKYVWDYPLNYISPEVVQSVDLHVVGGLGWLQNKRI